MQMEVRLTMLESTNALVAGVGSEDLQQKVITNAAIAARCALMQLQNLLGNRCRLP